MSSVRNIVKRKLRKLKLDDECIKYLAEAVQYCVNKNIHPIDICLNQNVYPNLSKKYIKSYDAIETHIRRDILKAWKETDPFIWKEELNYSERPTVKRIIALLLEQFDY